MERTEDMLETLAVFQPATFWLKADADRNICAQHRPQSAESGPPKPHDAAAMPSSAACASAPSRAHAPPLPTKPSRPRDRTSAASGLFDDKDPHRDGQAPMQRPGAITFGPGTAEVSGGGVAGALSLAGLKKRRGRGEA
jgi:hypothetical protein